MRTADQPPMRFPWPPVILLSAVALAILLGTLAPLPWLRGPFAEFLAGIGALIIVGGATLAVLAVTRFRKTGTPVAPTSAAQRLVTDGPFAISRNPIYLGGVTILIGLALVTRNPWFILAGFAAGLAISFIAIRPEERHLDRRFGKAYRDYSKRVRRWF
jgi:protein-S-isoprenylcysteine O-methyltransferase Ste14